MNLLSRLAVLVALYSPCFSAYADVLTFGKEPQPVVLDHDIMVTRVSIRINGFAVGGFADYCLNTWRREATPYPIPDRNLSNDGHMGRGGYIENLCLNTTRRKAIEGWIYPSGPQDGPVLVPAGDWIQEINLADTPIYYPAGTMLLCDSLGSISSIYPAIRMDGTCKIDYRTYAQGEPRYRFLRLPYFDQTFSADEPLASSHFTGHDDDHPLRIPAANIYFVNNYPNTQMTACLTHERDDVKLAQFCPPPADQDSVGKIAIGWTIEKGDRIALNCSYADDDLTSTGDCVVNLIAEIPDVLQISPENAFRDYGEFPRDYVDEWCAKQADAIKTERVENPMLCLGADSCSREQKISNCRQVLNEVYYPRASCMSGGQCFRD